MTETAIVTTPKIAAEEKAVTLLGQAIALVIITNDDRVYAEELIQSAKILEDEIFNYLDPSRALSYARWQYDKKRLDDAIIPAQTARATTKQKCVSWDIEQERIRKEVERKAQEEERQRAEQEQLEAAIAAEQEGNTEAAEAILEQPIQPVTVIIPKTTPAPSRLSAGRTTYSATVTDLMALVKAIADGKVSIQAVTANMVFLNGMARNLKEIPGVKVERKIS